MGGLSIGVKSAVYDASFFIKAVGATSSDVVSRDVQVGLRVVAAALRGHVT